MKSGHLSQFESGAIIADLPMKAEGTLVHPIVLRALPLRRRTQSMLQIL